MTTDKLNTRYGTERGEHSRSAALVEAECPRCNRWSIILRESGACPWSRCYFTVGGTYRTIEEIEAANEAHGHHFFESATKRFFRSRIGQTVYGGRFFVTSEQFDARSPRLYTVRRANDDGSIGTASEFQQFSTSAQAKAWIMHTIRETEAAIAS